MHVLHESDRKRSDPIKRVIHRAGTNISALLFALH